GWEGQASGKAPLKLKDLAQAEKITNVSLAAGFGERLIKVSGLLEKDNNPGIYEVKCFEPYELIPRHWINIFCLLANYGTKVEFASETNQPDVNESNTDLGLLHKSLCSLKPSSIPVQGDGSLIILSAEDSLQAATALTTLLFSPKFKNQSLTIIKGCEAGVLNQCLKKYNMPKTGSGQVSQARFALQIIPLALNVRWAPFDPQVMIDFLSVFPFPLPGVVVSKFKRVIFEHPGRFGEEWKNASQEAVSRHIQRLQEKGVAQDQIKIRQSQVQEDIKFWLEGGCYDPVQGMPSNLIVDICIRLRAWAAKIGASKEESLFMKAVEIIRDMELAIQATGAEYIPRPQLNRILDSAMGEGLPNPEDIEEAADWSVVDNPGQIIEPQDNIIWWGLEGGSSSGRNFSPWNEKELDWMEDNEIYLEPADKTRVRESWFRHQAIRQASKRLILVMPIKTGAESSGSHPLWDEIRFLLNLKNDDAVSSITLQASSIRSA
ncbi:MAG: hypothetical protein ABR542_11655, partial [Desulfonatronovibrio sp.]